MNLEKEAKVASREKQVLVVFLVKAASQDFKGFKAFVAIEVHKVLLAAMEKMENRVNPARRVQLVLLENLELVV